MAYWNHRKIDQMLADSLIEGTGRMRVQLYTGDTPPPDAPVHVIDADAFALSFDPDNYRALIGDHLVVVEDGETVYSGPITEYECPPGVC